MKFQKSLAEDECMRQPYQVRAPHFLRLFSFTLFLKSLHLSRYSYFILTFNLHFDYQLLYNSILLALYLSSSLCLLSFAASADFLSVLLYLKVKAISFASTPTCSPMDDSCKVFHCLTYPHQLLHC